MWKSGLGSQATYRALMEVFVRAGRLGCAKSVVEILREGAEATDTPPQGASAGTTITPGIDLPTKLINVLKEYY